MAAAGRCSSALAASLHLAIIVKGGPWYRFFGAGEEMARMAEAGRWLPTLVTAGIAAVLFVWSAYALAAAGWMVNPARLPWLKLGLSTITAVYLLRGLAVVPLWWWAPTQATPFWWWSSAICLGYGLVHLSGLVQVWPNL
ncbi:MAG: hypothetical protein IPF55_21535 [Rhodoferax sp.]|nr:hypothetical protein [Rhodoferax sp.]